MTEKSVGQFAWYLDITPNQMFSLYEYPIPGKEGLTLCEKHGRQLEQKEVVVFDRDATVISPPDHCWVCNNLTSQPSIKIFIAGLVIPKVGKRFANES